MLTRAETLKQQFTHSLGLPLHDILPVGRVDEILAEEHISYRNCIYTPVVTLWVWITQVLDVRCALCNFVGGGVLPSLLPC